LGVDSKQSTAVGSPFQAVSAKPEGERMRELSTKSMRLDCTMPSHEIAFFQRILAFASAGHVSSLMRMVTRDAPQIASMAPLARAAEPYGRLPLYTDTRGEVMLAGWQSGARCAPHDHGEACGLVVVLRGWFSETRYDRNTQGLVRRGTSIAETGSVLPVANGLIHDLSCNEAGATLHVYTPPIANMRVYDTAARTTWLVNENAGAWIPRNRENVVAQEPWTTDHVRP